MLGWLAKKGQNSRVYMCVKEVKWELETGTQVHRATILAMASLLRVKVLEDFPTSVMDRPLDYSREDLMRFYEMLENIRNMATLHRERLQKSMASLGMALPDFAIAHAKVSNRALEVWMCTLGAGIVPDQRDEVRQIWRYLSGSFPYLATGIANLRKTEQMTARATGSPESGMFGDMETNKWLEASRFVPSAFVNELKL